MTDKTKRQLIVRNAASQLGETWRHAVERPSSNGNGTKSNGDSNESYAIQVNHDALTGLFNQRYLDDTLSRELSLSWRRSASLSLATLDIDHFKRFNDTFGHDAGDMALRECAWVLSKNLRKSDIACRLGGDEFALVLPDSSLVDTRQRVEEICALIKQVNLQHYGRALGTMTVSVGIAVSPDHGFTAEDLLRAADTALYTAKQNGRGQVILYTPVE